jgi:ATP-dependent Zn protease
MSDNQDKNNNDKKSPFDDFKGDGKMPPNNMMRNAMLLVVMIAGVLIVYLFLQSAQQQEWPVSYTKYKQWLDQELILEAKIIKNQIDDYEFHGVLKEPMPVDVDGKPRNIKRFVTKLGVLDSETEQMWDEKGLKYTYESGQNEFLRIFLSFLPWIILIGFFCILHAKNAGRKFERHIFIWEIQGKAAG